MSNRKLALAALAEDDLRSILQHSKEQWGERQRDLYARDLRNAIDSLVDFPSLGRKRDDLATDIRGLTVRDYLILYRSTRDLTTILRIIHVRRDIKGIQGL